MGNKHAAYYITVLSSALLILSLITYVSANAQNIPGGSYKDTCRSIQVLGGTLTAQCQKVDGSWKNTALQYNDCEGGITNQNGNLTCKHGVKPVKPLPKGSYKKTCKDTSVDGKWLYAKCQRTNGNWNNSSIKYADCNKDIWNNNGVLTCGGGARTCRKGAIRIRARTLMLTGTGSTQSARRRTAAGTAHRSNTLTAARIYGTTTACSLAEAEAGAVAIFPRGATRRPARTCTSRATCSKPNA